MSSSCIYEGTIRHRRLEPAREFSHRLALAYLDLDEVPGLLGGRLLARRPGPLRFRRGDYHGDPSLPLGHAVRNTVQSHIGIRPQGPVRVLTQLRSWGMCFNPVSFYYCFEPGGQTLSALVAEVTNTPWGERHAYVMAGSGESAILRGAFDKALHVSPFMGMEHRYEARSAVPGQTLSLQIASTQDEKPVFDATLALRRRALDRRSAASLAARYPLPALRVLALIYGHAVGLKLAGARVHPHSETVPR